MQSSSGSNNMIISLLISILLISIFTNSITVAAQDIENEEIKSTIKVKGNKLEFITPTTNMTFSLSSKGRIIGVKNLLTDQELDIQRPYHLFYIDGTEKDLFSTNADSFRYTINKDNVTMVWKFDKVEARVKMKMDESTYGLAMWLDIKNNDSLQIEKVVFPYIGGIDGIIGSEAPDELVIPDAEGYGIPNAIRYLKSSNTELDHKYPGGMSMQFFSLYQQNTGGFYFATHDPKAMFKGIQLDGKTYDKELVKLSWYHFPFLIKPMNDMRLPYPVIIASFKGNWESAADLYREWAIKQEWVIGLLKDRSDVPEWLKQLDLTWKIGSYSTLSTKEIALTGIKAENVPSYIDALKNKLKNENILIEWWGWNKDGFDRSYPEYYPPRDGEESVKEAIEYIHKQGLKVMFYFNGYIIDTSTNTFAKNKQYMVVNKNGEIQTANLESAIFTYPNPRHDWWKETLVELTTKAVRDYKVDAVYLDQMLTAPPRIDYSFKIDDGVVAGGYGWRKAESNILDAIRTSIRSYNPEAIMATERVNEVYIPYIDAFWTGGQASSIIRFPHMHIVPLFSYVYHGYAFEYVRSDHLPGIDYAAYNWVISETLARGQIPGGVAFNINDLRYFKEDILIFFKQAIDIRKNLTDFMVYGKMLPQPYINSSEYIFTSTRYDKINQQLVDSSVAYGAFESLNGDIMFLLSNRTPQRISTLIDLRQYNLNITSIEAYSFLTNSINKIPVREGSVKIYFEPLENIVFIIEHEKDNYDLKRIKQS